jgi:hypothetical protein
MDELEAVLLVCDLELTATIIAIVPMTVSPTIHALRRCEGTVVIASSEDDTMGMLSLGMLW